MASPRLSCSTWNLVPWPGVEPGRPALEVQSLSHWTTRKVPLISFFPHIYTSLFPKWKLLSLLLNKETYIFEHLPFVQHCTTCFILNSHNTPKRLAPQPVEEDTETQRDEVTCQKPHSWSWASQLQSPHMPLPISTKPSLINLLHTSGLSWLLPCWWEQMEQMNRIYSASLSLAKAAPRDRAWEQVPLPPVDRRVDSFQQGVWWGGASILWLPCTKMFRPWVSQGTLGWRASGSGSSSHCLWDGIGSLWMTGFRFRWEWKWDPWVDPCVPPPGSIWSTQKALVIDVELNSSVISTYQGQQHAFHPSPSNRTPCYSYHKTWGRGRATLEEPIHPSMQHRGPP